MTVSSKAIRLLSCLVVALGGSAALAAPAPEADIARVQRECRYADWGIAKGDFALTLEPTSLAPTASGTVRLRLKKDSVRVRAQVRRLEDPGRHGVEYLTYVAWSFDEQGNFRNLGELQRKKSNGRFAVEIPRQAAGFLITAEPHFAVAWPSELVVLRAAPRGKSARTFESRDAACRFVPAGSYAFGREQDDLALLLRRDRRTPGAISQALNAVEIARQSGAEEHARARLDEARAVLLRANDLWIRDKRDAARDQARAAVESAEVARRVAVERQRRDDELRGAVAAAQRLADERALALEAARQQAEEEARRREALERELESERQRRADAEQKLIQDLRDRRSETIVVPAPAPAPGVQSAPTDTDESRLRSERAALEAERSQVAASFERMRAELAEEREQLMKDMAAEIARRTDAHEKQIDGLRQELDRVRLEAERAAMRAEVAREEGRFEAERALLQKERELLEAQRAALEAHRNLSSPTPAGNGVAPGKAAASAPVAERPAPPTAPTAEPGPIEPSAEAVPTGSARVPPSRTPPGEQAGSAPERPVSTPPAAERVAAGEPVRSAPSTPERVAGAAAPSETATSDTQALVSAPTTAAEPDTSPRKPRRWWAPWRQKQPNDQARSASEPPVSTPPAAERVAVGEPVRSAPSTPERVAGDAAPSETATSDTQAPVSAPTTAAEPDTSPRKPRRWWAPWRKKQPKDQARSEPRRSTTTAPESLAERASRDEGWFYRTRRSIERDERARPASEASEASEKRAERIAETALLQAERARMAAEHERAMAEIAAERSALEADRARERTEVARPSPAEPKDDELSTELLRQREQLLEMQRLLLDSTATPAAPAAESRDPERTQVEVARSEFDNLRERLERAERSLLETEAGQPAPPEPAPAVTAPEPSSALETLRERLTGIVELQDSIDGVLVRLGALSFASGKFRLEPGARESLARVAGVLLGVPGWRLLIEGHTDDTGDALANQTLSEQRATEVALFLQQQGLSPRSMDWRGFGESRPIASNATVEGRKSNRRVDLIIRDETVQVTTQ